MKGKTDHIQPKKVVSGATLMTKNSIQEIKYQLIHFRETYEQRILKPDWMRDKTRHIQP